MASGGPAATARIELRTTPEAKALLARAASHAQLDLTSYILAIVVPAAQHAVEHAEEVVLSQADFRRALELLESPPAPTPALIEAARRRAARQ